MRSKRKPVGILRKLYSILGLQSVNKQAIFRVIYVMIVF